MALTSQSSAIFGKVWVVEGGGEGRFLAEGGFWVEGGGGGGASSPGHERHWLILLGLIVRVVFEFETQWAPNIGT
jgi:hypothetical protein